MTVLHSRVCIQPAQAHQQVESRKSVSLGPEVTVYLQQKLKDKEGFPGQSLNPFCAFEPFCTSDFIISLEDAFNIEAS